jgi:hypothetical protein
LFEGQVVPLPVYPKLWQLIATSHGFFIDCYYKRLVNEIYARIPLLDCGSSSIAHPQRQADLLGAGVTTPADRCSFLLTGRAAWRLTPQTHAIAAGSSRFGYLDAALGGSGLSRGCEPMSSINQPSALNGLEDLCKLPVNSCMFG